MVVIIDCGIGNISSVSKMISKAGGEVVISNAAADIENATLIVFPGVGSFDNGIRRFRELESFALIEKKVIDEDVPFIGICIGMQLLFECSEEGKLPGLGWIPGQVTRFDFNEETQKTCKVPHMGWNVVESGGANDLLEGDEELRFYFVHAFHATNVEANHVMGLTNYGYPFVSAVARDNIYGVQFHPEKSHRFGCEFFKKFLAHIQC